MSHSRAVLAVSFAAAFFLGAGLGETALAATTIGAGNASVTEGNSGSQSLNIPLTRGGDSTENIAVQYRTADHPTSPAAADTDYVSIGSGLALLPPGTGSLNLPVYIYGDTAVESNENFYLNVTSAHNAGPPLSFAATANFAAASVPRSAVQADFNGDGKPDLAVANQSSNNVSVLLNTTTPGANTPTYAAASQFPAGSGPYGLAVGDVNGDGTPDLAVTNNSSNNISVLLNTTSPGAATASFSAAVNFSAGGTPYTAALNDLNGDGKPDLVVAIIFPGTAAVLLNTTAPGAATPSFAAAAQFPVNGNASSAQVGDLNGDGLPDIAVANYGYNTVSVLLNTMSPGAATPTFAGYAAFGIGTGADYAYTVALADVNGDGKLDLATANHNTGNVSVMLNGTVTGGATPNFGTAVTFAAGSQPIGLLLRDLNGDGRPDLAVTNFGGGNVTVLYNAMPPGATAPVFVPAGTFTVSTGPMTVAAADVNGDGLPDLAVADAGGAVSVLINTTAPVAPPPAFAAASNLSATFAIGVAAGDINGDGRPDLFAAYDGGIRAWMNTMSPGATTPAFSIASAFGTGSGPIGVALGDFNGDGKPDLAAANSLANTVSVLLSQTGAGATLPSFQTASNFTVGSAPYDVAVADFNGDGKPDLVSADYSSSSVSILLNTTATGAGTATFATAAGYGVGANQTTDVGVADFNGDGKPDLVATIYNNIPGINVLLNTTATGASTASFSAQSIFAGGNYPYGLATADFNGDGKPDVVTANQIGASLSIYFNTTPTGAATPTFASAVNVSAGGINAFKVEAVDINGDGKPDLCVANYGTNDISILTNKTPPGASTPTFASVANSYPTGRHIEDLALADFNGDGRLDLAGANYDGNSVSVLLNQLYAVSLSPGQGTGTIVDDDTDSTPDAFTFTSQTNVPFNTPVTSNTITITGITVPVGISVRDSNFPPAPTGEYSIGCNGTFVTTDGTVNAGDTVCVRHTSSGSPTTTTTTTLRVSNISGNFSSTTEATDTTPFAFAFTDATDVAVGSAQESNTVTITGINTASAVSVAGGEYRKNGGSYTTAGGSVVNGDTVQVRHTASLLYSTATDTTLTVGGVSDTFSSTTAAQDTTPAAFTFTDEGSVTPGSTVTSNAITVSGINSGAAISVAGGSYSIDGGSFTATAGTVQDGQTVQVRHTASSSFATGTDTTLTIGGVSDTFTSTTAAQDTTPDSFAFTDVSGAALGATQESNVVTIGGITGAVSVTASGGEYRKNGGSYTTSAGTVSTGDTLQLRHTAAATPATTVDTMLTVGSVSDTFSSTTVPADTTPVAFGFTDPGNVTPGSTITSDTITVAGINTGAAISVTGGSYRIDSGAFTSAAGTVQNGQTVQVQHTASSSFAATTDTTLTIGGVSDTFTSTTAAQDTTPNAFTFTDVTEIAPGSVQESGVVTIDGITGAVAATVNGGEYRKNGGAYTSAAGTVVNGDTLQLRQVASSAAATTTAVVLTVGTMSDSWSVTTASPPAGGGGGGGPLSPVALLLLGLACFAREARSRRRWLRGAS